MFRRISAFVGAAPAEEVSVETVTVEVIAGKVSTDGDFNPKSVWVSITVLAGNQVMPSRRTRGATQKIKLAASYTNQWLFRDKIELPKQARIQIELRCHFDETNEFGGLLLADSIINVSSLSYFSSDIEMDMKDISAAMNVTNTEYGKSQLGSVHDIEQSYIEQSRNAPFGQINSSASTVASLTENVQRAGGKCSVTLRLKYDPNAASHHTGIAITDGSPGSSTNNAVVASSSSSGQQAVGQPNSPDHHNHETSRVHKISVGKLFVTLWQGKSLCTSCPVYVTMFLATLRSKGCKTPTRSNPHNPVFDYMAEIDIYSLQGDLVIEVWEEQMAGANKLGQTVIPISWLLHKATIGTLMGSKKDRFASGDIGEIDMNDTDMTMGSWFEVFPPTSPTPFNRGGQYRPYYKGLPIAGTGYGLTKPEKPVGFLKLDISLHLKESFALTLLRNPWVYAAREPDVHLDEDEFALKAVLVAGFTLLDIFNYLWDPPILKKLFEILNWHTYPLLSFFVLFLFSYLALMAAPWQYPYILLIIMTTVGLAAAVDRNFDDVKVFSQDNKSSKDKDGAENENKSYTEMYKEMKAIAISMEKSVSLAYSILTKANNLLMGSDPILSGITFIMLLIIAIFISIMLCIFSPNQVFWFGGLSFFTPPELQDYIVDSMFQQLTKMQEWLISFAKKQSGASVSTTDVTTNDSPANSQRQNSDEIDMNALAGITRNLSNVSSVSLGFNKSASSVTFASGSSSRSIGGSNKSNKVFMDDNNDNEFVEREVFRTMQLFSYNWLKNQTYKWLKMVPDDVELRHRHICAAALVTKDQLLTRLPIKKKQFVNTGNNTGDLMASLLSTNTKSNSFGDYVSTWMKGSLGKKSLSFGGRFTEDIEATSNRRTSLRASMDEIDVLQSMNSWLPRTLGELFPGKAKPIVITIPGFGTDNTSNKLSTSPGSNKANDSLGSKAKLFRISVHVIAARGLQVKESLTKSIGSMAAVRSKIYGDVTIQPVSACNVFFRTGGQPKSPNPQFREEFVFDAVGEDAMFLVVEITRKSAIQAKGWETFLGQAVVSFDSVVKMFLDSTSTSAQSSSSSATGNISNNNNSISNGINTTNNNYNNNNNNSNYNNNSSSNSSRVTMSSIPSDGMPGEVKGWFPLVEKTSGERMGEAELNLSIEIGLNHNAQ